MTSRLSSRRSGDGSVTLMRLAGVYDRWIISRISAPDPLGGVDPTRSENPCDLGEERESDPGDSLYPARTMTTPFDTDTAVTPIGPGQFEAKLDPGWWIVRGPNGGYIAAILVNALAMAVGDAERELRSVTIHYLRPPTEGRARIDTTIERSGRTLTTVTARMHQEGVLQAIAIAAFALGRGGPELHQYVMPEVAPPEKCTPMSESHIPIHQQYEHRFAVGPNYFEGEQTPHAITGGWLRLRKGRPLDAALLVAYTDAWPPAVYASSALPRAQGGVPTIDLTVHVRAQALSRVGPVDPVLVVFRTREVRDGYLEEDGEIWSRDGELLAHSRQLGLML